MKKILSLWLFFFVLLLSGCGEDRLKTVAEEIAALIPDQVTESLELPRGKDGVEISWVSGIPKVLSPEGKVTRQEENIGVKLIATLQYKGKELELSFIITVLGMEEEPAEEEPGDNPGGFPGDEKPGDENPDEIPDLPDYYDGFQGLIGEALKQFLHDLIDDHKKQSYDKAKEYLLISDQDPKNPNNFILFYSGRSIPKSTPIGQVWDREHVWAKSHGPFSENSIPGSDLHHLKPSDRTANGTRGNLDFDIGGRPLTEIIYAPNSTLNKILTGLSFEPRDEDKGDVARMIFYMAVRYEGGGGEPDLELNDRVNNGSTPYMGRVSILLRWNREDPVDDFERNRNEMIYGIQGNRNPFIDYPEFAEMIWGEYLN